MSHQAYYSDTRKTVYHNAIPVKNCKTLGFASMPNGIQSTLSFQDNSSSIDFCADPESMSSQKSFELTDDQRVQNLGDKEKLIREKVKLEFYKEKCRKEKCLRLIAVAKSKQLEEEKKVLEDEIVQLKKQLVV